MANLQNKAAEQKQKVKDLLATQYDNTALKIGLTEKRTLVALDIIKFNPSTKPDEQISNIAKQAYLKGRLEVLEELLEECFPAHILPQ